MEHCDNGTRPQLYIVILSVPSVSVIKSLPCQPQSEVRSAPELSNSATPQLRIRPITILTDLCCPSAALMSVLCDST